jgi:hypothetical protein
VAAAVERSTHDVARPWTKEEVMLRVRDIVYEESGLTPAFDAKMTFQKLGIS